MSIGKKIVALVAVLVLFTALTGAGYCCRSPTMTA